MIVLFLFQMVKIAAAPLLAATLLFGIGAPVLADTPLFDDHVHLHDGVASLAAYRADLAKANVSVARIGAMWFGGPNQALAGDPAAIRQGNDSILALAAKNRDLLPIATVHPYDGEAALVELERVAKRGIKVLKIHPHTQKFDASDPRVKILVTKAGALGLVVLMDNAGVLPGDSETLFNLALACPKTKFIFAHLGGMGFRFWNILLPAKRAKGLMADNVYFDISATVTIVAGSPIQEEFVWTMRNVGLDHLLLGSDYPQYTLPQTLAAFEKLGLSEVEKAQVRYGTAQELLGLK